MVIPTHAPELIMSVSGARLVAGVLPWASVRDRVRRLRMDSSACLPPVAGRFAMSVVFFWHVGIVLPPGAASRFLGGIE